MLERDFQRGLIARIKRVLPSAIVVKNDADYIQGIPDLLVLCGERWAALEVKRSAKAPHRPNQDHYISKLGGMGFAAFICPENEDEVLSSMLGYFGEARQGGGHEI